MVLNLTSVPVMLVFNKHNEEGDEDTDDRSFIESMFKSERSYALLYTSAITEEGLKELKAWCERGDQESTAKCFCLF